MDVLARACTFCRFAALTILSIAVFTPGIALAVDADELRALFVSRIVKYVDWPEQVRPGPEQPVVIAAADARALKIKLGKVSGIRVEQWPVANCHALYFNKGNMREIKAVLDKLKGRSILTIGQDDAFLDAGGMVNMREQGGRLRLEIAPETAARENLNFSARLMSISIVRDKQAPETTSQGRGKAQRPQAGSLPGKAPGIISRSGRDNAGGRGGRS